MTPADPGQGDPHHRAGSGTPVVVSVGSCPRSGNVFKGSYAIDGPLEKWVHVDVAIARLHPQP